jgi:hypothetical protein
MKSIPALASLRALVIEDTKRFDVPWHILERNIAAGQPQQSRAATPGFAAARKTRAWYVIEGDADKLIAGFMDAKGSCKLPALRLPQRPFHQEV